MAVYKGYHLLIYPADGSKPIMYFDPSGANYGVKATMYTDYTTIKNAETFDGDDIASVQLVRGSTPIDTTIDATLEYPIPGGVILKTFVADGNVETIDQDAIDADDAAALTDTYDEPGPIEFNPFGPNKVLSGPPSGVDDGLPTARLLVAADIPVHSTDKLTSGTLPLTRGGTGGTSAATARTALGAAALGANTDITSLAGITTPLSIAQGGTGAATAAAALTALGAAPDTRLYNQTVTGDVDGVNAVFVLASDAEAAKEAVHVNGVRSIPTTDYAIVDDTITFVVAPLVGSAIRVDYTPA